MFDLEAKTTFTLAEAAQLLSCHRETLRRAIRKGALPAAKLGRGFRISRVDLEAFWATAGGGSLFEGTVEGGQPLATITTGKTEKKSSKPLQLSLLEQAVRKE